MTSSPAEASGKYWDKRSDPTEATKRRWFDSELIVKHCNAKIAGKPLSGRGAGIRARLQQFAHEQPISRGVSVACGSARTELGLLMAGLVETFDLYEASRVRLEQARSYATKHNVVDRVRFNLVTGPDLPDVENADLVYWKAALHPGADVGGTTAWDANSGEDELAGTDGDLLAGVRRQLVHLHANMSHRLRLDLGRSRPV